MTYENKLKDNLRSIEDSDLTLTDFSIHTQDSPSYTINDLLEDTSKNIKKQAKEILNNERPDDELSLTDAFADVVDNTDVHPSLMTVYLVMVHRNAMSLGNMVKDVFDLIDDDITAELFDFYLSSEGSMPTVIEIALKTTMTDKEFLDSHDTSQALQNDLTDFSPEQLN
jgi:hypothetical protein